MRKFRARIAACAATMATAGAALVAASLPTTAAAATAPAPYATAELTKISDGTGHGTPAQTFITSDNGFAPADDTPTDGVVSSGDTVTYQADLTFTAGPKRDVRISWDMSNAPYLQGDTSYCTSGQQITARVDSQDCIFTVNAGAVETITRQFTLTATDTGGTAKTDQLPILSVKRDTADGQTYSYRAAPVTVVSAPAVDVELLNHAPGYNSERKMNWTDAGTLGGYFEIVPRTIRWEGKTNSHGSSLGSNTYSGTVDVSAFPDGTTYELGNTAVTPSNGRITLTNLSGIQRLTYHIPASAVADMQETEDRDWAAQLTISPESFASIDDDAMLNNGTGAEPGSGKDKAESTYNSARDIRRGYPYPNNNWSRAWVYKQAPPPPGAIFSKNLYRPYSYGTTVFDESRQSLSNGESRVAHWYEGDIVVTGAEVRTELSVITANIPEPQAVDVTDFWTRSEYKGSLKITANGAPLDPATYTVAHSDEISETVSTWQDGEPTASSRHIKVALSKDAITSANRGNITISFVNTVTATADQGNSTAPDTGCIVTSTATCQSDYVKVIAPADPSASLSHEVTAVTANGVAREQTAEQWVAQPGDTVDYKAVVRMHNIQFSETSMVPTVTMTKPAGIINPRSLSSDWKLDVDGDTMTFRYQPNNGAITPVLDSTGMTALPVISWSGQVGNTASGTLSTPATATVDIAANKTVPAVTVTSNTATATVQVNSVETTSAVITSNQSLAEINDPLSWTFNIYAAGQHDGSTDTVIRMPSNSDAPMEGGDNHNGLDGTWAEYDRGRSAYHGGYTLSDPVTIQADNSTQTSVLYSTTDVYTDDPAAFDWKTWDQLTDADKQHITALKVTSQFAERAETLPVAASHGTVTITPSENTKDDRYVMWLGRTHFSDNTEPGALPWGDVAQVVAGTITGTVWWDDDQSTRKNGEEAPIPSITMSLFAADKDGKPHGQAIATTATDDQGNYSFDMLHSGSYAVSVARTDGTTTDSGVQTQTVTYYGDTKPVSTTRSYRAVGDRAGNDSGKLMLGIGAALIRVDFGFAKPDPKVQVEKKNIDTQCNDASCTIKWDVEVTNNSPSTVLPASSVLTDRMTSAVRNVSATAGVKSNKPASEVEFEQVSGGHRHSMALDSTGHLWTWGYNFYGQLGEDGIADHVTPTAITPKRTYTAISAGNSHSMALDTDGHLWTWGYNFYGQLGDGTHTSRYTPALITPERTYTAISTRNEHSLALDNTGHLWAWGTNGNGELGDGTHVDRNTPTAITPERTYTAITAGNRFSAALDTDGHLWTWGDNFWGRLGDGTSNDHYTPTLITPERTYTAISTGGDHSMALDSTGHLWTWAGNLKGQLGDGTTTNRYTPTLITPERTYTVISAGGSHSMALDSTGHLWAWGANGSGRLGDGTSNDHYTPTLITPERTYTAISAGNDYSMTLDNSGHLWAWGDNGSGRLGDGTTTNRYAPIRITVGAKPAVTTDNTAVPVIPASENTADGYTTRTYNLPFEVQPGGKAVYHLTGTVTREEADQLIANQSWFNSPDTPYAGTPHAREAKATQPELPSVDRNPSTGDLTGTSTCRTGSDYTTSTDEHSFSPGNEDSCDQVGVTVPKYTTAAKPQLGMISGLYWEDINSDGIRDAAETLHPTDLEVHLLDENGDRIATTTLTDAGTYEFRDLELKTYRIQFSLPANRAFTTPHAPGSTDTTRSDASTDADSKGLSLTTIQLTSAAPTREHIDAGLLPIEVTPAAPELVAATECGATDTVAIPEATEGLTYTSSQEGNTVTITVAAQPGYTIPTDATTSWTFELSTKDCPITPEEPQLVPAEQCGAWDTVTVPDDTDAVTYIRTDDEAAHTVTVTATAAPGHSIDGQLTKTWTFDLTQHICPVTPVAPVLVPATQCGATDTVTVPEDTDSLDYTQSVTTTHVSVTVKAKPGYSIPEDATTSWEFDLTTKDCPVTPIEPTLVPATECGATDTVTIPENTEVITYTSARVGNHLTVTATAAAGHSIDGKQSKTWEFDLTEHICPVEPVEPTLNPAEQCGATDTVTVPEDTESLDYEQKQDGDTVTITVTTKAGYSIAEGQKTEWTFELSTKDCPVKPVEPKLIPAEQCGATDTVEVPEDTDGLHYERKQEGNKVTVAVTVKAGYSIPANTKTEWTFELSTKDCPVKPVEPKLIPAEQCGATDTVTVPEDTDTVTYTRTDDEANRTVTITATAAPGHSIDGGQTKTWKFQLSQHICPVEPTEPKLNPAEQCGATDTVTVPEDTESLDYEQKQDGDTVTITVTAKAGYSIAEGQKTEWTFELSTKDCPVKPVEPKLIPAEQCGATDTVTVPEDTDALDYTSTQDGNTVTVTATPKAPYRIADGAQTTWTLTLNTKVCPVEPTEPKLTPATECGKWDTVTLPEDTAQLAYTQSTDPDTHVITVTATAKPGYSIDGKQTKTWTLHPERKLCPVTPEEPKVKPAAACGEEATIEVPTDTEAVRYELTTDTTARTWTVTAHIADGYSAGEKPTTTWTIPMPEVEPCPVPTTTTTEATTIASSTTAEAPTAAPSSATPASTTPATPEVESIEPPTPESKTAAPEQHSSLASTGSAGRVIFALATALIAAGAVLLTIRHRGKLCRDTAPHHDRRGRHRK